MFSELPIGQCHRQEMCSLSQEISSCLSCSEQAKYNPVWSLQVHYPLSFNHVLARLDFSRSRWFCVLERAAISSIGTITSSRSKIGNSWMFFTAWPSSIIWHDWPSHFHPTFSLGFLIPQFPGVPPTSLIILSQFLGLTFPLFLSLINAEACLGLS